MGATLGAGFGRLMGLYRLAIDNLLSLTLNTAAGNAINVTPERNPGLWWALRGAGANFGIVTSATLKPYAVETSKNGAWTGGLIFTEDKI
jgi:FAD/FMN-containing dehydrogenase